MNYLRPELLDQLAREYVLGTLAGGARRRFEAIARDAAEARQAILAWQERLAVLELSHVPVQPPVGNWAGIERRLFGKPARSASWWQAVGSWFPGRALGGVAAGVLVAVLTLRSAPEWAGLEERSEALPQSYVGLLHDAQDKPALLASSRRHGRQLTLKVLAPLSVPPGMVARLWAVPKTGAPFLLGTLPAQGSTSIDMPDTSERLLFNVPRLGVTVESADVAATAPGAFVLTGSCVKLW
ncbi:anti-sigma-K factor RskA [Pelomonas saccharophila]|uniref:Anti-sigma-K factor RskA n=1 Tax=Roseateles saccharophilus TaxID=304 RepID=A0ABU1YG24_ROSSA|nr:anti-sigma factor [Roseateles saccharophilus]MDR7267794.1 anti-sigma-K factor RskA [Roseateles saccharophilus]